jgi:DNA-binding response OmpR family regulator
MVTRGIPPLFPGYLPDILLLDVMMPTMSGHQVCQKLRELYPMTTLPIIMISAKSNQENILEGFNSGCVDYVVKPFSRHELLARIKVHLRQKDLYFKSYKRRKPSPVPRSLSTTEGPLLTDAQRMTAAMVETIPMASVLIADICQYEQLSSIMCAEDMYLTVNQLFVEAEKVASRNKLTLIEHAGDYLVFVAVDDSDPSLAAKSCVSAALEMLQLAQSIKTKSGKSLGIACGIQSGVVFSCDDCGASSRGDNPGTEKSKLNYFGKTVNQACEIEEVGPSMTIGIGAGTRELIGTAFKTEPWKWGKSMKRYIIVDSVCDWKAGLEYVQPEFATGSESENEGKTHVVATSDGHPARLKPSARKSRNHKILELELHKEKDRALKLTEKASKLESEVAELKVLVEKLQASRGKGDERKADVTALMDQVKRLESERRMLEKKLASKTMESQPLISVHGETFTMNGNKGTSVTLGAGSSSGEMGGSGRRPSTHSPPAWIDSRLQSAIQGGSGSFKDSKQTRSSRDVMTTHESNAPGARSRSSSTSR